MPIFLLAALGLGVASVRWIGRAVGIEPLGAGVLGAALALSAAAILGDLLAVAGVLTPGISALALSVLAVILWVSGSLAGRAARLSPPPRADARSTLALLALIVLVGATLRTPPVDAPLAGRDQGTYVLRAQHIARTGSVTHVQPLLTSAETPADVSRLWPRVDDPRRLRRYEGAYRPGLYLVDRDTGALAPQFFHAFPALLAMSSWVVPLPRVALVNILASCLWLVAIYLLVRHWTGRPRYGLAVAGLLAVDPLAIWVGRTPLTEPMDGLLWACAALGLTTCAPARGRPRLVVVGAWCLGSAAWMRGNLWIVGPLMLASVLAGMWWVRRHPASPSTHSGGHVAAVLTLSVMIAGSVTTHVLTAYPYVHDELLRMLPARAIEAGGVEGLLIATAWLGCGATSLLAWHLSRRTPHAEASSPHRATPSTPSAASRRALRLLPALAASIVVGRAVWTLSGAGAPLARVDLLVPAMGPALSCLALLGVLSVARRPMSVTPDTQNFWVWALGVGVTTQLAMYSVPSLPRSGLMYYGRYLLPQVLPLAFLFATLGAAALSRRLAAALPATWTDPRLYLGIMVAVLGWHAGAMVQHPQLRLVPFAASRDLVRAIEARLPDDAVVIAGGEGWVRRHTYNQVGGALELGAGRVVLPYRSREASYAAALALLAEDDLSPVSDAPEVYLLLNESSRARPDPHESRVAVLDATMPAPLRLELVETYELFDHRLERTTDRWPTRVLRNELRLGLFRVSLDDTAHVRRWTTRGENDAAARRLGDVLRCRETKEGVLLSTAGARPDSPAWSSGGWLLLRRHGPRSTRELSRVIIDGDAVAVDVRGDPRDAGPATGPWWRARPPQAVELQGPRTCDGQTWELVFAAAAPTHDGPGSHREEIKAPHLRFEPDIRDRRGYGETRWTSGVVLNRFRLPVGGDPPLRGDAIELRVGRDLSFPATPLRAGGHQLHVTLLELPPAQALRAAAATLEIEVRPGDIRSLDLGTRPSNSVWVASLGALHADRELVISARLRARDPSLTVLLREITLTPTPDP